MSGPTSKFAFCVQEFKKHFVTLLSSNWALIRLLFVCMLCSLLLQQLSKDKAPDPVVTQVEWVEPSLLFMSVYVFSLVLTPPPSLALYAVRKVGRAWYFSICLPVDFSFPLSKVLMWAFVLAYCISTFRHTRAIYNSQLHETTLWLHRATNCMGQVLANIDQVCWPWGDCMQIFSSFKN